MGVGVGVGVAAAGVSLLVSSSFSKSLSLYGERVGALSVVTSDASEAARVLSQLKRLVRTNYSSPPTHGAKIVAAVLSTPETQSARASARSDASAHTSPDTGPRGH